MKTIKYIFFLSLFGCAAQAQTAPDFSVTDTDGVTWNLHEQLGLGKTVVLDFFYVDCVPCQGQSPEVAIMYNDYLAANANVLVVGISNRDLNDDVEQFDLTYNISYPTAGTEGGGDTITELYQSWFSFFGWPSYGVICSDTTINWGILPSVPGVPELRSAVDACLGSASISEKDKISHFVQLNGEGLSIISQDVRAIMVSDLSGRQVFKSINAAKGTSFELPPLGICILTIELQNHQIFHQKIFR